jgi:uncharacterized membrane protein YvlD (DUF360 family)
MEQLLRFDVVYWVTQIIAMALTALVIPNLRVTSIFGPVLAVIALALVNTTVWSSDLFSQIPGSLSTQAVTLLAINAAIFWLIVKVMPGIESKGILPVLAAPVVFTVCAMVVPQVYSRVDWKEMLAHTTRIVTEAKSFVGDKPHDVMTAE